MEPFPTVPIESQYDTTANAHGEPRSRSSSASKLQQKPSITHRRSRSGSLIAKFPFLRGTAAVEDDDESVVDADLSFDTEHTRGIGEDDARGSTSVSSRIGSRRRKSSLRKTALLGTGRFKFIERKSPLSDSTSPKRSSFLRPGATSQDSAETDDASPKSSSEYEALGRPMLRNRSNIKSLSQHEQKPLTLDTSDERINIIKGPNIASPSNTYASTTDDDEGLSLPTILATSTALAKPVSLSPTSSESSVAAPGNMPVPVQRRRSTKTHMKSPLSMPLPEYKSMHDMATILEEEWDYSTTEWWGWIILLSTWVIFIIGMGSCFEVWSWAWDVGQTPYAPPELEDDPTLPIVGYYPALMVLTAVVSWIWVMIAWVGMKYFKHAKIQGEDT